MSAILLAVGFLCFIGFVSLLAHGSPRLSNAVGAGGAVLGCLTGLIPTIGALWSGRTEVLHRAWNVPCGSFSVQLDSLSALFLLPIFVLCALAALYGSQSMAIHPGRKSPGVFWFFFNLLSASMALVALAANGVLFLMAWEVMAVASFFLVTFENERESVRRAGWIYLVATHLGSAFLLVLFLLMGSRAGAGSLDFDQFLAMRGQMTTIADTLFILAVIGFGAKAGFIPLHVWLPEAHPAAPSHVSAVMSGVMIKTGIYGLLRTLSFLGAVPLWWGWLLIGIGLTSGVLGVLFALAQHDLKRLLAYHSVENIGIITLGIGVGLLGMAVGAPALTVLGLGGGLLHVINHALFKGLLFLGAGSVLHATGTREMDRLGGLIKRMPWTGATFLIGSVAICGLPPLNGFVSELLIYLGAFRAVGEQHAPAAGAAVIIGLALIGGLAAACFTKAFGIVFLGEPRSEQAAHGHEVTWVERISMLALAGGCVLVGLFAPQAVRLTSGAAAIVSGLSNDVVQAHMSFAVVPMHRTVWIAGIFIVSVLLLVWARCRVLSGRRVDEAGTWDCGYTRPAASMQYTSSSFAQPLVKMFQPFLHPSVKWTQAEGLFPSQAGFHTHTDDLFTRHLYHPIFLSVEQLALKLRFLQSGRIQLYILYIGVTLLALLIWNLR